MKKTARFKGKFETDKPLHYEQEVKFEGTGIVAFKTRNGTYIINIYKDSVEVK